MSRQSEAATASARSPSARTTVAAAEQGADVRFGPVYEAVLDRLSPEGGETIFDLERGRQVVEPAFEMFNCDPKANIGWIRSSGLDLSGLTRPNIPGCIFYYMALVSCPPNTWDTITASEVLGSKELNEIQEPKRRVVLCGSEPTCYLFRTWEGTSGMLLLPPAAENDTAPRIRYKLVLTPEHLSRRDI